MKIFIVGMPGSANLGDDLISQILVKQLVDRFNPSIIGILTGECPVHYDIKGTKIEIFKRPNKRSFSNFFVRLRSIKAFLKDVDLLVIGGGGLLQDTHYSFTVHKYLRYIKYAKKRVALMGIGVGPLKFRLNKIYLKIILNSPKLTIQVRDVDSLNLLRSIGVKSPIHLSTDIVEGSPLPAFFNKDSYVATNEKILGCSIRKWPDINLHSLTEYIVRLVSQESIGKIKFFVFEHQNQSPEEKEYAEILINEINNLRDIKCELYVYGEMDHKLFYENLTTVTFAIASRFHANIIWQKIGIPVVPIVYAPKVSSLYQKYNHDSFRFSQLVSLASYPFIQIPELMNNNDFQIPPMQGYIKINLSVRFALTIYDLYHFLASTINSLWIRIK
ncbi:Polysaccharide pyruvyl transferase family protein WcaK [Parapedobacter composti]|uniref:Polysaccharide pyruvyl transferase family protein WcaK n=1 Tax=Parapedobacter composti TaxID=623281 RepID=A0A1I1J0A0_9SPHI|nr:polysaccharide pyruvyl transferase family protein [Parapedobacter composti]SFC38890.1 Polysaccharide pyruvyl transferase family protein WcaK [Parapedobacter composti]